MWYGLDEGDPIDETTNLKAMAIREAELVWIRRRIRDQILSKKEALGLDAWRLNVTETVKEASEN